MSNTPVFTYYALLTQPIYVRTYVHNGKRYNMYVCTISVIVLHMCVYTVLFTKVAMISLKSSAGTSWG